MQGVQVSQTLERKRNNAKRRFQERPHKENCEVGVMTQLRMGSRDWVRLIAARITLRVIEWIALEIAIYEARKEIARRIRNGTIKVQLSMRVFGGYWW